MSRRRAWRVRTPRSGTGTSLILMGFIMLPSAVLGYLSWQAIQSEKSYSLERLQASYRQFAALAARQMDYQLSTLESRWIGEFERLLASAPAGPTAEIVGDFMGREPLIANYFLLTSPGRVLYPAEAESVPAPSSNAGAATRIEPESEFFTRLVARGEELEYGSRDLKAAVTAYRGIVSQVGHPRLRAIAESHVGRVQLKDGDWTGALATFTHLLARYPEVRDLNRMYLRFLAQYQIAVAMDALGRGPEALEALLGLNRDLLRRSDAITTAQYSYYVELIRELLPRLLDDAGSADRERYAAAFAALGEQSKKRISAKYFLHLLDAELSDLSFQQQRYSPGIRYMTARAEGVPFLLAYRALPDPHEMHVTGLLAAEIDLVRLQGELFAAMRSLHADAEASVAILGTEGVVVLGAEAATGTLMASQAMAPPFDSWQVAIYLRDVPTAMRRLDLRHTLWTWVVSVMLLSIIAGGYLFIARARRQTQISRAQTTFVSNVSHELRTPLASIRMFAELLELQMDTSRTSASFRPKQDPRRYLEIIRQECDRLNRLVERVLDFSRMDQNVREYRFERADPGTVVHDAVESFRPYAEARGFDLRLTVEEPLPTLKLDADALAQVLLNLLTNAVQYSADEKSIHVTVGTDGSATVIQVVDRGVGIEPAHIRRVFEKFYSTWRRMDDRTQGGLGLGLTLSREIVWAHGGDITVRSEPGRGSTFTVTLPLPPMDPREESPPGMTPESEHIERMGGQRG